MEQLLCSDWLALCSESKYLSVLADIYALLTKLYRSRGLIIGPIGMRKIWPFRSSNLELRLGQYLIHH